MTPTHEVQEKIRAYLLGQLSGEAREEIERELMANEQVFAELLIIEDELTDEFVSDNLSSDERAKFEKHFLATPERHDNLQFAQALNRYVTTDARAQAVINPPPLPGFFSVHGRLSRIAAVIALLAITAAALWFLLPRQTSPRTFATVTLSISTNTRDEGLQATGIKLPRDKDALRIFLKIPNQAPPAVGYRVQLLDGSGESTSLGIAGRDTQSVMVEIPSSQLRRGQYAVNLFAIKTDGSEQRLNGSYYFTIE